MNDKVFDMAEGVMVQYAGSEEWVFTSDELKRLGEAIVRECAEQIEKWTPSKFENDFEEGAVWAFEESVIRIKEHFGIDNESLPYTVTYRS